MADYNANDWRKNYDSLDSKFKGDNQPIVRVSWNDADEYCQRLSNATNRAYRLPTEAEWEYACRAGTQTPFAFGNTINPEVVNYDGNVPYGSNYAGSKLYREETVAVGSLPANNWGLHEMHGNVYEWCADQWYDSYSKKPEALKQNGSIPMTQQNTNVLPTEEDRRVLRGGSWYAYARSCRSAGRDWFTRANGCDVNGFRVVCVG
jgi:formylglycine-generating enzyme required for sulfatase activity